MVGVAAPTLAFTRTYPTTSSLPPATIVAQTQRSGNPASSHHARNCVLNPLAENGRPQSLVRNVSESDELGQVMGDSGCTVHEIAAVTGHRTLKEVQRYTESYDRKQAAKRAQAKVAAAQVEPEAASNVVALPLANR
jgi:hypothetical protein